MRKKIAIALAAGVAFGTMFAAPVSASVAEAASSESVLKLKSPAETFATQGDKLYAERKYAEAGEAYKKAAEEDEKNDQYWFQAGISFQNAGKPHSAADCFKKAVKLQPNNGIYNKWLGVAYWAQTSNPGGTSTDTLQERAMKYTGRAAELLPNDIDAQATAGVIEEAVGDSVRIQSRSGWFMVFPGAIERHFKKAYQYYRRAVEIDPSKTENIDRLNRFVSTHSEYGFQPYGSTPQSANPSAGTTGNRPTAPLNTPESLKTDGTSIQDMLRTGKIKAYNAGAGFEWWDEEARADFEALPFPDDIEVVAGNVYRVTWDDNNPDYIKYIVIVPRHVRIHYGAGEEDAHDSLLVVEIASKGYDDKGAICLLPTTMMNDECYIRKGRTREIVHFAGDEDTFSWKWLEEGQKEIEEQQGSALPMLGAETYYTFEDSGNPELIILRGHCDERTWTGKMELVPSVVTPPFQG